MDNRSDDQLALILWDYNNISQPLKKSDAILVLGSNDLRVAKYGSELFLKGYAPLLIFSGGYGGLTRDSFDKPEAEVFADEAIRLGVPKDKILIEKKSTNTGENIVFTRQLLEEKGLGLNSFIVVQKPYMLRRTYATFKKQWPGKEFVVTAPPISFEDYPNEAISKRMMIDIMVGDTQRIKEYPAKGFQIPQEMPPQVWLSFEELVKRGYNRRLIKKD